MNRYLSLVRRSWRSGEYRAGGAAEADPTREDGELLRESIRSKMEWIVERESGPRTEGRGASVVRLSRHVRFRQERLGGLLFETRSEKAFRLSPSGAAVVKELSAGADSEADVVARLKARFRDPDGAIEKQARAFLADLRSQGFLDG
jgi:hypothetical protein